MMSSPSSTANGWSPTCRSAVEHRVSETERLLLTDVVDVRHVADGANRGELGVVALASRASTRARTTGRSGSRSNACRGR